MPIQSIAPTPSKQPLKTTTPSSMAPKEQQQQQRIVVADEPVVTNAAVVVPKTDHKVAEENGTLLPEPLLTENPHRFVIFPIQDNEVCT